MLTTLSDGSALLQGARCAFTTTRLRPGALFTTIQGHDEGDLGRAPIETLEGEHARFKTPADWFIDARGVQGVSGEVLDTWTAWLATRPACLAQMHVLPGRRSLGVTLAVARHLSGSGATMQLHDDLPTFEAAVRSAGGAMAARESGSVPVSVEVDPVPRGGFQVRGAQLAYRFDCDGQGTVLTQVAGRETGALGDVVLDRFDALLRQTNAPVLWHLNLEQVTHVATARAQAWAAWLAAREACFCGIEVCAPSPGIALFLLGTQYRFRNAGLMRIVRDPMQFRMEP